MKCEFLSKTMSSNKTELLKTNENNDMDISTLVNKNMEHLCHTRVTVDQTRVSPDS